MSIRCGRGSPAVPAGMMANIQNVMRTVEDLFPTAVKWIILNPKGEIVTQSVGAKAFPEAAVAKVSLLTRAVLQLADTTAGFQCRSLHVKGSSQLLSCYGIGDNDKVWHDVCLGCAKGF
eukprot:jgi/Mesvir1/29497/Mv19747-RA.1